MLAITQKNLALTKIVLSSCNLDSPCILNSIVRYCLPKAHERVQAALGGEAGKRLAWQGTTIAYVVLNCLTLNGSYSAAILHVKKQLSDL